MEHLRRLLTPLFIRIYEEKVYVLYREQKRMQAQSNIRSLWRQESEERYGTAKKKRPGYLVGNLVATNWPIEKALHAIGYNQIPTK